MVPKTPSDVLAPSTRLVMRGSLVIIALFASCVVGRPAAPSLIKRGAVDYYNPTDGGGSMLDNGTYSRRR